MGIAACGGELPRDYDVQAYELRGHFDWTTQHLVAQLDISVVVAAGSQAIELDSAVGVTRVHAGEHDLPFTADPDERLLTIDLATLSPAGSLVRFTIDYEAAVSGALVASSGRDADPVTSRVVFTFSEPMEGARWLPGNHHPADRARFAVELTVAEDEDVVSNGTRVRDDPQRGGRVVRYEMTDPIPTYIMAFAAGQIVHRDRAGAVPLSVWYRRGLAIDPDQTLDAVADAMATFERLLGPYPFERYSVVLVPEFGGGMENATITFADEASGQGNVGFNLHAHELAHHWFGDYVTVASFDDLWIKEGMATLLAAEADRARRDGEHTGRLLGRAFGFRAGDKIRDLDLALDDRYTSGPYARAAWLLTQIRARVGDAAFWGTLREVLADHALGHIDSERFLESFAPELDAATIARAITALEHSEVPAIAMNASGATLRFTVSDPGDVLLAPLTVTPIQADGSPGSEATLTTDQAVSVSIPDGGYLALDEREAHVEWTDSFRVEGYGALVPFLAPAAPGATMDSFLRRSAAQQERALWSTFRLTDAAALAGFYAGLDSTVARRYAELDACRNVQASMPGWAEALPAILRSPSLSSFSTAYSACGVTLATATFGDELVALAAAPSDANAPRLAYLMSFDYGAQATFTSLSLLATSAPSLQLRELAITRLGYQTDGSGYSAVPDADQPAWRSFFRDRLAEVTSQLRFLAVWRGVFGLRDATALALAGAKLQAVPMSASNQRLVVCQARSISVQRAGSWEAFQDAAQPWDQLQPAAREVLSDPSTCTN
jgi:aminopeptidase N